MLFANLSHLATHHTRWLVCGLLFFATTINYLDRQSLAVLKTTIEKDFQWAEADFGWIMFSFQSAYAIFLAISGRIIDRIGVKLALGGAVVLWSLMAGAHALVTTTIGFCIARFLLGAAESFNFPASIKAVAQWHPQKERALSTGIFNSGSNVGIMLAAGVAWIVSQSTSPYAWRLAFVVISAAGFVWLFFWMKFYDEPHKHPRLTKEELALIEAGQPASEKKVSIHWTQLLRYRETWAFLIGKFLTDPVWWFYLYWLPSYLEKERGLSLGTSAMMIIIPYVAADIGSIGGGWISSSFIKRGWRVGPARYVAMLVCALCMPGAILAASTSNFTLALALISLAAAGHQGWSANIFTTGTDLFPAKVAGSVIGLGGTTGAIGGMLMTLMVGLTLSWLGDSPNKYLPIFIWAGLMHPLSLGIMRLFAGPDMKQVDIDAPLDMSKSHSVLLLAGTVVGIAGLAACAMIGLNWDYMLTVTKTTSAASAGLTAMIGISLIGMTLIYAGLPKRNGLARQQG